MSPTRYILVLIWLFAGTAVAQVSQRTPVQPLRPLQPLQPRTGAEARLFDVARLHAARPGGMCDCRVCDRARKALAEIRAQQAALAVPGVITNQNTAAATQADPYADPKDPVVRTPAQTTYTPPTYRFSPPVRYSPPTRTTEQRTSSSRRPKGNNGVGNGLDPAPPGNPRVNDGAGTRPGSPGSKSAKGPKGKGKGNAGGGGKGKGRR